MRRIWPDPADLDETGLAAAYAQAPGVRVNFVASVDGAATLAGRSGGLGNPADQRVMGVLREAADVVLVGAGTVRAEGYDFVRPHMAIVSRTLDLDPDEFAEATVITVSSAPAERRSRFRDVVLAGDVDVDGAQAVRALQERGLGRILCEGGPHLLGTLEAAGVVDEFCLTLSPTLAGPGATRVTAGAPTTPQGMRLAHALTDDEMLFLRYERIIS
ncbi:pyrimidine reductase family protein [Hamadaea tsunoensis]|uniref:pyrimidine reductase family protein n=1 Tax=Hamadaea tsunoensis TaxID=53368 RepID=UPI00048758C8|nr:pyrimidine reductase family protein [Hamadaea tsunoensis]